MEEKRAFDFSNCAALVAEHFWLLNSMSYLVLSGLAWRSSQADVQNESVQR